MTHPALSQSLVQFFSVRSRLGLLHPPFGSQDANLGVEDAPTAILSSEFLKAFPGSEGGEFVFPTPDRAGSEGYFAALAAASRECADFIAARERRPARRVVVGGDHSVSLPSLLAAVRGRTPSRVGYLHVDSHTDLNTSATTPSGNFHGMVVRAITGDFDRPEFAGLGPTLTPSQVCFVGDLVLDPEERRWLAAHRVPVMGLRECREGGGQAVAGLERFAAPFDHVHVSVDVDVLTRDLAPATGTPPPGGLTLEELGPVLGRLARYPSVSVDVVEVNPRKPGGEQTVRVAQEIIRLLVSPT